MSSTAIKYIIARTIKTTALLSAVVFLLFTTGCTAVPDNSDAHIGRRKVRQPKVRRRANEYSRIPNNYPASWQTSTVGN